MQYIPSYLNVALNTMKSCFLELGSAGSVELRQLGLEILQFFSQRLVGRIALHEAITPW